MFFSKTDVSETDRFLAHLKAKMGRVFLRLSVLEMRGFVLPEQITARTIITMQSQSGTEPSSQME